MVTFPLIMLLLFFTVLTSACAELECSARTDVDPYEPMRDKQRCVAEADKNLDEYQKAKAAEEKQRLKTAIEQATQKSLM
ncbi:hypothetical protein [Shewanella sp. SM74]|uniref:hypothetical protein n=1 Tax=Shewanella sp. SM74 TaxID=2912807 RepID=UPI0021D9583C|nr:hypothetical protein [Shewanella sp. SM74]MCU8013010.1 hypothetical protein [Shewanella sp. SM74]